MSMGDSLARRPAAPSLQNIDGQQQRERNDKHGHRDRCGAGVVILLQFGDDQKRRDLRAHRHIACDEDHRAVFADCASEGHGEAGERRRENRRQENARESLPAACAEARRSFFELLVQVFENRLHGADDEGQSDEGECDRDSECRVGRGNAQMPEVAGRATRSESRWW